MSRDAPRQEAAVDPNRGNGTHNSLKPLQKEAQSGMRDSSAVRATKKAVEDSSPGENVTELKDYVRYQVLVVTSMPPLSKLG